MRKLFLVTLSAISFLSAFAQGKNQTNTETRVIIRDGSFAGEKPLVLVDGKVVADINSISPDRIATVDVLKGEGAIKLYGSEGKNGVIVIKTKTGSSIDTMPLGTKKVERIVTVNTVRKSDGSKDTTIIRSDSMTVKVDGDNIIVNGMPLDMGKEEIVGGLALPRMFYLNLDNNKTVITGNKTTPKLGLSVQDMEDGKGVEVLSVTSNGAAAKAGVLANDRIIAIDETTVSDVDGLRAAIEKSQTKRSVMVHLQRGKKDMHLELVFPRELKKAEL